MGVCEFALNMVIWLQNEIDQTCNLPLESSAGIHTLFSSSTKNSTSNPTSNSYTDEKTVPSGQKEQKGLDSSPWLGT
jgi:hypothetical protein